MSRTRAEATTHALNAVIRTRRFWLSVARHSVPIIGVLAFGWAPMNIAVFFLLESWLYLTSRAAIEVTFDPHFAGADLPVTRWDAIRKTIWMLLLAGVACGVLVVALGGVMVLLAFPVEQWRTFLERGHTSKRRTCSIRLSQQRSHGILLLDRSQLLGTEASVL